MKAKNYYRKDKWYNWHVFPLVPLINTTKSDEHNTSGFSFKWLFFRFWSLDSFEFELSFCIDTHWGIGITFILPYLRGIIVIPCPHGLSDFIYRKLHRKVRSQKNLK